MGRRVRILCIISGLLFAAGLVLFISGCTDLDLLQVIRDRVEGVDVAPTFTVTYDKNSAVEGSLPEDTTTYEEGQTVTVLANSGNLKKTDYLFSVWNTSADGSGIDNAPGASFVMGTANVTLFAKWITPALWTRTVNASTNLSWFESVAVDGSGNLYAGGEQRGTDTFIYGNQSVAGPHTGSNAVLVKYNGSGTVQWARSVSTGSDDSYFYSVAVDGSGNVYAAGYQDGTGSFTYGSLSLTGAYAGKNIILVKYNSSGTSLWARTVSAGSSDSFFDSAAVDDSGNVYAAGYQSGTGTFTYGALNVAGTYTGSNVLLVKYNDSGTEQWARIVSAGTNNSKFDSVAVDGSGNVYAAGYQTGTDNFTYGSQNAVGTNTGNNAVIVKYNSLGTVQWAQTVNAGTNTSFFDSVVVDGSGNVYAAGYQVGTGIFTYGSQNAAGTYSGPNVILVKYNDSGTALWARTVNVGSDYSYFKSVAVDGSDNVYASGYQAGTGTYTYGSQNAAGTYSGSNAVLVKYNSSGTALWARTVSVGPNSSYFNSVVVDGSGKVCTAGCQNTTGTFTFGGQSAAGTYSTNNALMVKWEP